MRLSIVMPIYNEEATAVEILNRVLAVNLADEIIVVDDGSTDGTAAALEKLTSDTVRIVSHPHNRGKGAAVRSGIQAAHGDLILIQDGARYHTSKATREFIEQHKDRLIVYQLPSYSPDYNPIEYLWKKVKTKATHNRYFAEFVKLVNSVEEALHVLAAQSDEILRLMGVYTKHIAEPLAV